MLFEVVLRQLYNGRNVLNRWHYNSSGTPAAVSLSFALASAFGGIPDGITGEFPAASVMAALAGLQSVSLQYVELVVEALYDVSDFYTIPYAVDQIGTIGGNQMSPYDAYAIQSNRVRTDIRRGNKRLAGVSESLLDIFGALDVSGLANAGAVADAMSETLEYDDEGTPLSFLPCILSFEPSDPPTDPQTYEKYATLSEQLDHAALGITWVAKPYVTTQNTRKR